MSNPKPFVSEKEKVLKTAKKVSVMELIISSLFIIGGIIASVIFFITIFQIVTKNYYGENQNNIGIVFVVILLVVLCVISAFFAILFLAYGIPCFILGLKLVKTKNDFNAYSVNKKKIIASYVITTIMGIILLVGSIILAVSNITSDKPSDVQFIYAIIVFLIGIFLLIMANVQSKNFKQIRSYIESPEYMREEAFK